MPIGNYTLMCQSFTGPGHEKQARLAKETYINATGHPEFFIYHDADRSELLYGGYKTNDPTIDRREAERAEADLKWLRGLKGSLGQPLFARSLIVPLPTADPEGNPAWDLSNVDRDKPADDPARKYWSLVIAAYTSDVLDTTGRPGDRKKMAVEAVRDARARGIEAYYYHGPTVSHVCIGAWPRRAMVEQESSQASSRSERAGSGEDLVVSSAPVPDSFRNAVEQQGGAKVVAPRIDVRDPDLLRTWKQYSEYAVNDIVQISTVTDPATGKQTQRPQQSFLVEIPETQKRSIVAGSTAPPATDQPPPSLLNPMGPSDGGGRLKRIGQ